MPFARTLLLLLLLLLLRPCVGRHRKESRTCPSCRAGCSWSSAWPSPSLLASWQVQCCSDPSRIPWSIPMSLKCTLSAPWQASLTCSPGAALHCCAVELLTLRARPGKALLPGVPPQTCGLQAQGSWASAGAWSSTPCCWSWAQTPSWLQPPLPSWCCSAAALPLWPTVRLLPGAPWLLLNSGMPVAWQCLGLALPAVGSQRMPLHAVARL